MTPVAVGGGLLLALALALGTSGALARPTFSGVVTHVSDGDTVWVRPDGARRKPLKLRIRGIDAPERCQAGGAEASAALKSRLLQARVEVRSRASDRYGRLLVELRDERSGDDVGAWMVERGQAWSDGFRGRPGPYAAQEREARRAHRGLFTTPDPLPPALFRRRHGPCD
ncbi:MAG: thermonuclease family protein [Burkholderiaceae bacterium]